MDDKRLEVTMCDANWIKQLLTQAELQLINIIKQGDFRSVYSVAQVKFSLDLVRLANGMMGETCHDLAVKWEQVQREDAQY